MIKYYLSIATLLISLNTMLYGQITTNHVFKAVKATAGNGLHKGKIFWISWDLNNNNSQGDALGDQVMGTYTSPAGYEYQIKLTKNSGSLLSASTTDYSKNSFPFGYTSFSPDHNIIAIKQNPNASIATFKLEITAKDPLGNIAPPKGIVIAGSESLNGQSEYYTLKTNTGLVRVIDKYIYTNSWSTFNVQLQVSDAGKTIKATQQSTNNGDGKGDVMLYAENVSSIDVELKGGGGQHIALGFMEDIDYSDAPLSYGVGYHVIKSTFSGGTYAANGNVNLSTQSNTIDIANPTGQLAKSIMPELYLGAFVDADAYPTTLPTIGANPNLDDLTNTDDEDALPNDPIEIDFDSPTHNVIVPYVNNTSNPAYLTIWVDKNRNGIFESNEKIQQTIAATPPSGNATIDIKSLAIPLGAKYYTRLRYSSQANLLPTGFAPDGEVEDHFINFYAIPYNIYGNIYLDQDGGIPDGTYLNGVTVRLLDNNNTVIATTTSANGSYYFQNLVNGNYKVKVELPSNAYKHVSSTDNTPADGLTSVTLLNGNKYGIDFGLYFPVCYKTPTTSPSGGKPITLGITSLDRAGDASNWPMVRKGAWLALESKDKGLIINRVTANPETDATNGGQVPSVANPVKGMIVYDTTNNCLKIYTGTAWKCFSRIACTD